MPAIPRHVSSRQNPAVAACRALARHPDPDGARLLLDGPHLVAEALDAGLAFELVAVANDGLNGPSAESRLAARLEAHGVAVLSVTREVLGAMSPVRTPSGIVAIAARPASTADAICGASDVAVAIMAGVQDPGNVGALVRVAEAGGLTGALTCGGSASPAHWKSVRGSMGSLLRMPVADSGTLDETLACLDRHRVRSIAAVPRGGSAPDTIDWTAPFALWLGAEGEGLPPALLDRCAIRVSVPMRPPVESLNVSVAGALLIYAAGRVRPR